MVHSEILSIVICTFNRAQYLAECLDSLLSQTIDIDCFPVIVVDNNSTDDTRDIVEGYRKRIPQIRYIFEPEQGLSFARNKGFREAETEWVAYLDDDAKAFPDYLERIVAAINLNKYDCIGGIFHPWYKYGKPKWYKDRYASNIGTLENPEGQRYAPGGNMIIRREILVELGGFSDQIGMTGQRISYGEETRLQIAMAKIGYTFGLDESIQIEHLVARYKLSVWWLTKSAFAIGRDSWGAFMTSPAVARAARTLAYAAYVFIRSLIKNAKRLISEDDYFIQNLYIDSTKALVMAIGSLVSYVSYKVHDR